MVPARLIAYQFCTGCSKLFGRNIPEFMDGASWICSLVTPLRSFNLSRLYFFLWDVFKAVVYQDPANSEMDFEARLSCATAEMKETPGVFNHVCHSVVVGCA